MAHPNGLFAWCDLALPDTAAGADFYKRVFGWETEDVPAPESMPYSFFTKEGRIVAGMGPLSEEQQEQGVPPMWSAYIAVDDVDAVAARAGELGANVVMQPMDIMDAGRMAYLFDPTGAAVGLWQAGNHIGADVFNEPGAMCWNELATRDVDGAIAFYTELLGWKTDTQEYGGFDYVTCVVDDRSTAGIYDMSAFMPDGVPAHWSVYFAVDDTDVAVATARELGGQIDREPTDTPFGRMAAMTDPQGASFYVIALSSE